MQYTRIANCIVRQKNCLLFSPRLGWLNNGKDALDAREGERFRAVAIAPDGSVTGYIYAPADSIDPSYVADGASFDKGFDDFLEAQHDALELAPVFAVAKSLTDVCDHFLKGRDLSIEEYKKIAELVTGQEFDRYFQRKLERSFDENDVNEVSIRRAMRKALGEKEESLLSRNLPRM